MGACLQKEPIARTQREGGDLWKGVRAAFEDDEDDANGHAHLLQAQPFRQLRALQDFTDLRGERKHTPPAVGTFEEASIWTYRVRVPLAPDLVSLM